MINPYYVLRDEMLAILLEHIVYILNQWTSLPNAPQVSLIFTHNNFYTHTIYSEFGGDILLFKEHI